MQERSFYTFCISACVFIIFISLSINLVSLFGIFNAGTHGIEWNSTQAIQNTTKQSNAVLGLFTGHLIEYSFVGFVAITGLGAAIYLSKASGNWNILSAYLFSTVFWTSWTQNLMVFGMFNIFHYPVIIAIMGILTTGMLVMFIGAVIGLLHLGEG
jgi:hypothetical protein